MVYRGLGNNWSGCSEAVRGSEGSGIGSGIGGRVGGSVGSGQWSAEGVGSCVGSGKWGSIRSGNWSGQTSGQGSSNWRSQRSSGVRCSGSIGSWDARDVAAGVGCSQVEGCRRVGGLSAIVVVAHIHLAAASSGVQRCIGIGKWSGSQWGSQGSCNWCKHARLGRGAGNQGGDDELQQEKEEERRRKEKGNQSTTEVRKGFLSCTYEFEHVEDVSVRWLTPNGLCPMQRLVLPYIAHSARFCSIFWLFLCDMFERREEEVQANKFNFANHTQFVCSSSGGGVGQCGALCLSAKLAQLAWLTLFPPFPQLCWL